MTFRVPPVPPLREKEDDLALQQIQQFYPDCKVIQVQGCEKLASDGGVLNCVTWNVLADV
ncbi:MAG: agmatine deiminase family protein [Bacteroidales bacterium]|nr:agmatine deiminase family protein [Bacteroidales bacterium]